MAPRSKIFISYAHADVEIARRLQLELESRGAGVWLDEKEILASDSISQKIEEGLSTCNFFCIVLSPSSFDRPWVQREYRAALSIQLSQKNEKLRILPVVIDSEVSLPPLLSDIRVADFSRGFAAGLQDLCCAIDIPSTVAPFVDMTSTLNVDPIDLAPLFFAARKARDMSVLTPVWNSLIRNANLLKKELWTMEAVQPYRVVLPHEVDKYLAKSKEKPIVVYLPSVRMREDLESDAGFSFSYNLKMQGVDELLTCLGRWFEEVSSRRLYLVPESVSWESGWQSDSGGEGVGKVDFLVK